MLGSLLSVLGFNILLFAGFLLVFNWLRTRNPYFYCPRKRLHVDEGERWAVVAWVSKVLEVTDSDITESHGVDALLYIRFQRRIMMLLTLFTLVGMVVILPVNATADVDDIGFARSTAGGIEEGSLRLWIHTLFAVAISACVYWMLFDFQKEYVSMRFALKKKFDSLYTVIVRGLPEHAVDDDALKTFLTSGYPKVVQASCVLDARPLARILKKQRRFQNTLERYKAIEEKKGYRPSHKIYEGGFLHTRTVDDGIAYLTSHLAELETQIRKLRDGMHKGVGVAFVTFSTVEDARTFLSDYSVSLSNINRNARLKSSEWQTENWEVSFAPEPHDVCWENLGTNRTARIGRWIMVNMAVFWVVLFWSVPIAFLANLDNLSRMPGVGRALQDAFEAFPPLRSFLVAYLPTSLVLVFNALLPSVLALFSGFERHQTHSAGDRSTLSKYFGFLLFNTLILPVVLISSFDAGTKAAYDEDVDGATAWGRVFMTNSSVFFVIYCIQSAFLDCGMDLLRLPAFILSTLSRKRAVTSKELEDAEFIPAFTYGENYAVQLSVFAMVIFFSVCVPVIIPFGLLYFGIKHVVDVYNLIWVHPNTRGEGTGILIPMAVNYTLLSLGVAQCAICGFLSFYGPPGTYGITLLLPLASVCMYVYLRMLSSESGGKEREEGGAEESTQQLLEEVIEQPVAAAAPSVGPQADLYQNPIFKFGLMRKRSRSGSRGEVV